jgi:hypothetical protein
MDNPEKTEGAIKNGQSRENRGGNQEWTIQRKQREQSRMDNPEELAIKNGQSRKTGKIGYKRHRTKTKNNKYRKLKR